jgi:flagellar biogenesis protein FliO
MILVLGLIIGAMLLLARFARSRQLVQGVRGARGAAKPAGRIEVVSRRSLGKHSSLLVVRVEQRTFLVSQSAQQMNLLAELSGEESVEAPAESSSNFSSTHFLAPGTALGTGEDSPGAWDAIVDRLREITVRR